MRAHLRVTWVVHPDPEAVESAVIRELTPPLNQRDDEEHPLYETIRAARAARWASAGRDRSPLTDPAVPPPTASEPTFGPTSRRDHG